MTRRSGGGPDGVAIIDKATGWTSHDVVAKARGLLGTRKVGHSGTLDPDATGVLVLGVGRATRLLRFLQLLPKSYEAEIVLGVETSTLDASGTVTATHRMEGVSPEDVDAAAATLRGDIAQVPPMVSALKVGGRRLHELAREGVEVEREARAVHVSRFDLLPTADPLVFKATVECSSGTYVRSLAADLGHALGGGAHLRSLRRSAVGPFTLVDARPLEQVELLPLPEAMRGFGSVTVDAELAARVAVGAVLGPRELFVDGPPPWAVLDELGSLLAVYEPHRDGVRTKPAVVIPPL
ncbi:MAG: tRNA pseudouridine(55) synthase TruB [Microthrixaceae bacterium]|nr:tRNA pseudouridine(55) synthase TruB [Microthrixaceae bacterium]